MIDSFINWPTAKKKYDLHDSVVSVLRSLRKWGIDMQTSQGECQEIYIQVYLQQRNKKPKDPPQKAVTNAVKSNGYVLLEEYLIDHLSKESSGIIRQHIIGAYRINFKGLSSPNKAYSVDRDGIIEEFPLSDLDSHTKCDSGYSRYAHRNLHYTALVTESDARLLAAVYSYLPRFIYPNIANKSSYENIAKECFNILAHNTYATDEEAEKDVLGYLYPQFKDQRCDINVTPFYPPTKCPAQKDEEWETAKTHIRKYLISEGKDLSMIDDATLRNKETRPKYPEFLSWLAEIENKLRPETYDYLTNVLYLPDACMLPFSVYRSLNLAKSPSELLEAGIPTFRKFTKNKSHVGLFDLKSVLSYNFAKSIGEDFSLRLKHRLGELQKLYGADFPPTKIVSDRDDICPSFLYWPSNPVMMGFKGSHLDILVGAMQQATAGKEEAALNRVAEKLTEVIKKEDAQAEAQEQYYKPEWFLSTPENKFIVRDKGLAIIVSKGSMYYPISCFANYLKILTGLPLVEITPQTQMQLSEYTHFLDLYQWNNRRLEKQSVACWDIQGLRKLLGTMNILEANFTPEKRAALRKELQKLLS